MEEEIVCPVCNYTKIKKYEFLANEELFTFPKEKYWICKNCGCIFNSNTVGQKFSATKISKKNFFKIIFNSIQEVFGLEHIPLKKRIMVKRLYKKKLKAYYKEVAIAQANMFYEADCRHKEYIMIRDIFTPLQKIQRP